MPIPKWWHPCCAHIPHAADPRQPECERCEGRGLLGGRARWLPCIDCREMGRQWAADEDAIRQAYRDLFFLHPWCRAPGGRWHELLEAA